MKGLLLWEEMRKFMSLDEGLSSFGLPPPKHFSRSILQAGPGSILAPLSLTFSQLDSFQIFLLCTKSWLSRLGSWAKLSPVFHCTFAQIVELCQNSNFSISDQIFKMMVSELSSGRKMSRMSYQSSGNSHGMPSKLDRQRNLTLRAPRSSRGVEPLGRSSLRSKGSSNSSEDKVKMFKNCVRRMIEFLFTQVGVGAVVVCFTIVGASIFQVVFLFSIPSFF